MSRLYPGLIADPLGDCPVWLHCMLLPDCNVTTFDNSDSVSLDDQRLSIFLHADQSYSSSCTQAWSQSLFFFLNVGHLHNRLATPPQLQQVLLSHQTLQHRPARGCLIRRPWAQLAGPTGLFLLHLPLWELLLVWGAPNRPWGAAWGCSKQA